MGVFVGHARVVVSEADKTTHWKKARRWTPPPGSGVGFQCKGRWVGRTSGSARGGGYSGAVRVENKFSGVGPEKKLPPPFKLAKGATVGIFGAKICQKCLKPCRSAGRKIKICYFFCMCAYTDVFLIR